MASRRKKKTKPSESMERYKPPLIFIESPVNGSKYYCTPVQAAKNPYMVPSIPVDDLTDNWISPQFPRNDNSPLIKEIKRRRLKKSFNEETEKELQQIKTTIKPRDFEHKVQSAPKETVKRTTLRRSMRLKAKKVDRQEHFLFTEGISVTTKLREMKVLAPETPDSILKIPAVLRKLRKHSNKNEKNNHKEKK